MSPNDEIYFIFSLPLLLLFVEDNEFYSYIKTLYDKRTHELIVQYLQIRSVPLTTTINNKAGLTEVELSTTILLPL